ncbi:vitamin K epoxide reductase family protein [Bogoriella caseilytica]|uniref:Putative membrane protein n=1 Tax=Bogoriella caseilytica TaxID=56055 RepID=A0A3N2BFL8_9MICO|nr:vitamin K epoxide reductase family protein [Bogoriella caseilytica]ROR74056.1 putative membrane protein [Bogoriella caseilytica]
MSRKQRRAEPPQSERDRDADADLGYEVTPSDRFDDAEEPEDEEFLDEDVLLDQELARLDRARPSAHQRAGGAPRELIVVLIIAGVLGTWASVQLILSRITLALDPDASLGCDLNPLVGCGEFITSWQASAFGWPNAVLGTIGFSALLAVGVLFAAGARPATWLWRGLAAGTTFGIGWVIWFQYHALVNFRMLCPYCLVVWAVTIPVFVHVMARAAQGGHLPLGERLTRFLVMDRWLIIAGWYLALVVLIAVWFWDQWRLIFGF